MSFVVQGKVFGKENRAPGSPAGRENMQGGNAPPVQPRVTSELGTAVSVTSLTRSSNTATGSATAHGLAVGNIARIAGADQAAYNGDKLVLTVADANTFTFDVYGDPDATATGTITVRKYL